MGLDEYTKCADCGAVIHRLDVFPLGRCVGCHEVAHENDTPEELLEQIFDGFGGRR